MGLVDRRGPIFVDDTLEHVSSGPFSAVDGLAGRIT